MTARLTLLAALLTTACAAHEGESDPQAPDVKPRAEYEVQPDETPPEPEPEPEPPKVAKVSLSSVQMIRDCPDPAPMPTQERSRSASESQPAPAPGASAKPGRRAPGFAPIQQPCAQSMMQLAFTDHGPEKAKVNIKAVRILSADGKPLGEVAFRWPMAWRDNTYTAWDEMLAPEADLKTSYKLTPPDWSKVERELGSPSFGPSFLLEVDIEIAGVLQTVRSPEFVREVEHVIVT